MPSTDSFGTWEDLGTTVLSGSEWQTLSTGLSSASKNILRVTHIASDVTKLNAFCWIRTSYSLGGSNLVTKAIKLFPIEGVQLIRLEQYYELDNFDLILRQIQLQRFNRFKQLGSSPILPWVIKLEELQ